MLTNVYDDDAERYMELLPQAKVRGYLFEQQNYVPKDMETYVPKKKS